MSRVDRLCIFLLAGGLALPPAAGATSYARGVRSVEQEIDVRTLPSLLVEWQWEGTVDEWRLEDGVGYVVGGDRLTAIDLETGEELWTYDLELECSCSKLEVLPSRIVAGIDGRAILIDRASGALAADVALGESITALLSEPLVLAFRDSLGTGGVVRLDESSGVEVARYSPPGGISNVERADEWLIVTGGESGSSVTLTGLDLSLVEIWRRELPAQSWPRRDGEDFIVETWVGMQQTRQTLDPATGDLQAGNDDNGTTDRAGEVEVRMLAGGLALVLENDAPPVLIKPREGGRGDSLWQVELPVVADAAVEWGDQVVLAKEAWGERGILLVVDARDGEIVAQAAGLRGMQELHTSADLLVSRTSKGLAAVRLDGFGPSEAASMTVEEAVAGILAELRDPELSLSPYSVRQELEGLGTAAFPYLTDAIPEVGQDVLAMVATLLSNAAYEPAAVPLAARLRVLMTHPQPESEEEAWETRSHLDRLGSALAAISSAEQMPVIEQLLEHEAVEGYTRVALMAALGRFAPPRAQAALARLRAAHQRAAATWWAPPTPDPWLEYATVEVDSTSLEDLWLNGMVEEAQRLAKAAGTTIAQSEGMRWILFSDSRFGAHHFWAAPVDDDGSAGTALFVGAIPPAVDEAEAFTLPILQASLSDGLLEVGYAGAETLVLALDELMLDSDADGLTDRFEISLSLDPRAADSDGDGLTDPLDPAPRGRSDREPTDQEAALLALHEVLGLVLIAELGPLMGDSVVEEPGIDGRYLFLTEVPALEWRAGPVTTFVLEEGRDETCRAKSYRLAETAPRQLGADELAVEVVVACEAYDSSEFTESFVMRSTSRGWVLSGVGWQS